MVARDNMLHVLKAKALILLTNGKKPARQDPGKSLGMYGRIMNTDARIVGKRNIEISGYGKDVHEIV